MNNDWTPVTLGQLADIKHGFAFKGEYITDKKTANLLLTPGNFAIGGGFQFKKLKYYSGEVPAEYVLSPGDLVVTMTDLSKEADTLGYSARIPPSHFVMLHNQRLGKVNIKSQKTRLDFLHWVMRTPRYRNEVLANYTGSTVKHTSPTKILAYEFNLPPLSEQQEITAILGSIDDKIELNCKTAATLEEAARALYRSWFVDFDPVWAKVEGRAPAHMNEATAALFPNSFDDDGLPMGWSKELLVRHLNVDRGLSYKGDYLCEAGNGLPMHNLNSIFEGGGYKADGIKYYSGDFRPRHKIQPGDVIVANTEQGFDLRLIGHAALVPSYFGPSGLFSQHIYKVSAKPNSPFSNEWLYLTFSLTALGQEIRGYSNGTTVNMLPSDALEIPEVLVPTAPVVEHFTKIVRTMFSRQEELQEENKTLIDLRDTLLPKLMSGELRVGEAQELIEAVA